jgi:hypothetical protein
MLAKYICKDWRRVCVCGSNFVGRSPRCNKCADARKAETQRRANLKKWNNRNAD